MKSAIIFIIITLIFLSFGFIVRRNDDFIPTAQWILGIVLLLSLLTGVIISLTRRIIRIRQKKSQIQPQIPLEKSGLESQNKNNLHILQQLIYYSFYIAVMSVITWGIIIFVVSCC
jgi:uncharacterized integral membrane protein